MSDDNDLGKIPGVLVVEQLSDMSLREFVDSAIRSPSLRMRREGMFAVPERKPEDLFFTIDPDAFPKLSDEQMQHVLELVRPIVDEYFRNAEQMAQRCFIEPSNVFDVAREDAERESFTAVAPSDPRLGGYRW